MSIVNFVLKNNRKGVLFYYMNYGESALINCVFEKVEQT